MPVWLSLPKVFIPDPAPVLQIPVSDGLAEAIRAAYNLENPKGVLQPQVPTMTKSVEEHVGELVAQASSGIGGASMVRSLLDCRTGTHLLGPAPTYELMSRSGLTDAKPFALGGCGGTEPAAALFFILACGAIPLPGILCASQRIAFPDHRRGANALPLADGAVAMGLTAAPDCGSPFAAISSATGVEPHDESGEVSREMLAAVTVSIGSLCWCVRSPESLPVRVLEDSGVPTITRPLWKGLDFGCADSLITLALAHRAGQLPAGLGVVIHRSWTGSYGLILLEVLS